MAEVALGFVASSVVDRLSRILIQESAALTEVASKVEWIERELRQMQAYLEHVGLSSSQAFNQEVEELNEVARLAEDAIQTFVIRAVRRRRRGILYLIDKYKVGKELDRITRRIRYISTRTKTRDQDNRGVTVIVESPRENSAAAAAASASASTSNPNINVVAQAVEKLSDLLRQGLIARSELKETVEQARDELVGMENIVSGLKSTTSQRENVWLEEVNSVCDLTKQVAQGFISSRRNRGEYALVPFLHIVSEWKFRKQMEYVATQIGDTLHRRLTYGVGEVGLDSGDEMSARSKIVPSWSRQRLIVQNLPSFFAFSLSLLPTATVGIAILVDIFLQVFLRVVVLGVEPETVDREQKATKGKKLKLVVTFLSRLLIDLVIFIIASFVPFAGLILEIGSLVYGDIIWEVSLWRSVDRNLKSTQRDLALIHALLSDIESVQGLTKRQKVWVEQLRLVAQNAQSFIDAGYKKGSFVSKVRFANAINGLLYEIRTISDRKKIYGVANIEGRKGSLTLGPSIQSETTNSSIVEQDIDSSTEQQQSHAPAASPYRHVTVLRQKVQSIRGEKQMMDALSQDAQEMGELDRRSKEWVEEMKGLAREAETIVNDYAEKIEHKPVCIRMLKLVTILVIERKLDNIRNKIQEASVRRNRYDLLQFQTPAESFSGVLRLRRRTQTVRDSSIVGFDDDAEFLTAQLLSKEEHHYIISIVGIGGTGKTTLARLIFNSNAVKEAFEYRAWVPVPPDCTADQIVEDIAKELMGGQKDWWTTQDPFKELKIFLENKRCLIVVDGIETYKVLDPFKRSILDGLTACRLLLTSRNANVDLPASGTRTFLYPLQLLDDENSQILFRRNLKDIPTEPEIMKVGNKIVMKCGGLPSEILKVSELLSSVNKEEWSRVLEELYQDGNPWLETIKWINLNLPIYLRRCLFYFVLFPAEFGIPARRLVVLWIAEGLVHHGEDQGPPEKVAERYLTELIDRNMVQIAKRKHNGTVKTCRLPNALRELWLTEANETRFLPGHDASDSDSVPKDSIIRRVADNVDKKEIWYKHIHGTTPSPSALLRDYYKDVLSVLSFDAQEGSKPGQDIGSFLNRCIYSSCFLQLRVLDLERVYKPQLPKSIGELSRLRYLGLRWTYLESLPSSISSLLKLQTLDLKHTYINILTSSIWKMELRHLFLSESYRTRFPPQPEGNYLSDLQTLWGLFVDEETQVKGGLDRLFKIRKLGLTCQSMSSQPEAMVSQLDAVADWLMKLEYLQSLRLKSRDEEGRPWNLHLKCLENLTNLTDMYLLGKLSSSSILSHFPRSLVELTLSHSKLQDDPMQILKDFPNLQSLCLLAESYIGTSLACKSGSFPQLHVLKLWRLEQLEEWTIEQGALPCIRQLEIRSCKSLKMLPDGLQHISTLLELKLIDMPMELGSRVNNTNGDDQHKISHIPNVWVNDLRLNFASQSIDNSEILPHFESTLRNLHKASVSTLTFHQNDENKEAACAWKLPPPGWVRLNCNSSGIGSGIGIGISDASCGGIVRDDTGSVLGGFSANLGVTYETVARLWGILHGLNMVWEMGRRKVKVDVDSQCALYLIGISSNESHTHTHTHAGSSIMNRIKELLKREWRVEMCHVEPEANRVAKKLAGMGHHLPFGFLDFRSPPTCLADLIRQDLLHVTKHDSQ